jgi:hypothetical protein
MCSGRPQLWPPSRQQPQFQKIAIGGLGKAQTHALRSGDIGSHSGLLLYYHRRTLAKREERRYLGGIRRARQSDGLRSARGCQRPLQGHHLVGHRFHAHLDHAVGDGHSAWRAEIGVAGIERSASQNTTSAGPDSSVGAYSAEVDTRKRSRPARHLSRNPCLPEAQIRLHTTNPRIVFPNLTVLPSETVVESLEVMTCRTTAAIVSYGFWQGWD